MDNFDKLYKKACLLAENAHYSQKRWNGDSYITHPSKLGLLGKSKRRNISRL